jgi:hypothetical protein
MCLQLPAGIFSLPLLVIAVLASPDIHLKWASLPPLPDREGYAGSFAGVSDGVLLVAGGANFQDRRPWEGGTKVWYDRGVRAGAGLACVAGCRAATLRQRLRRVGKH